jgi:hypothetical protein
MTSSSCSLRTGDFPAGETAAIGEESESVGEGVEADWGKLEGKSIWAIAWRFGFVFIRTGPHARLLRRDCRIIG